MEIILDFIFSAFGEILVQVIGELFCELGCQRLSDSPLSKINKKPIFSFIGYCILGLVIGSISLLILPHQFIDSKLLALINLILTPIIAGLVMSYVGHLRKSRGSKIIRLDSFVYGFTFAFNMALIRFIFGG